MNISQINPSNNNDSIRNNLSNIWKKIPLFIRLIMIITIILYINNLFFPQISFYISNIPYYTVFNLNLWRIISTIFMTTEIINIIFSLLFWVKFASLLESSMGTIKYFLTFIINSVIIQIFYTIISCVIAFLINNKKYLLEKINSKNLVNNSGLWPYIICEITLMSLRNPNINIKFLLFPCVIKAKYYPIILFVIFSIMNSFAIDLEVLSGLIYSLFFHFFIKKKFKISNELLKKIENSRCFKCFTKIGSFVSVNTLGNKFESTVNNINDKIKEIAINQTNKGFTPFQGGGIMVGGVMNTEDYSGVNDNNTSTSVEVQKTQNESLEAKFHS